VAAAKDGGILAIVILQIEQQMTSVIARTMGPNCGFEQEQILERQGVGLVLQAAIGIPGLAADGRTLHGSRRGVNPIEHLRDYLIVLIIHLALAARQSVATHNAERVAAALNPSGNLSEPGP
jgi:hypothetical protein